MKTLVFDVMLDGRFVHTFRYQYCPLFPIDEEELEKFVTDRLPTLKGKDCELLTPKGVSFFLLLPAIAFMTVHRLNFPTLRG